MEFCQRVGSNATTVSEIVGSKDEAVYQAIEEGIRRVNGQAAARPYHIRKWAVLERDFSISGGELGRFALAASLGPRCCVGGQGRGRAWELPVKQLWRVEVPDSPSRQRALPRAWAVPESPLHA